MQNELSRKVLAVSAATMAAFYILIGVILLIYPVEIVASLTQSMQIALGIACIGYGGFRGYRAYQRWKESQ